MLTNDLSAKLNDQILCGNLEGEGVLIDRIAFKVEEFKGDSVNLRFEVKGEATAYLRDPKDPTAGVEPLDSPITAMEFVDLTWNTRQEFYDRLNRTFSIQPPLVDAGDETLERLLEGGDAYAQIEGKRAYFLHKHKSDSQYGPKYSQWFRNPPKVMKATKDNFSQMKAKLAEVRAKKEKKEADKKAMADALTGELGESPMDMESLLS